MSGRRLLAVPVAAGALACGALAVRAGDDPDRAATAPPLATPAWSARRVPQPVVDAVGAQRLQAGLDTELGGVDSCALVTDGSGESVLAAHNPDAALIPASGQKVLTALGALEVLGPDHRFETRVVGSGAAVDGAVERLWLVGSGDPVLATPEFSAELGAEPFYEGGEVVTTPLAELADGVVAAGVRRVPGGVQGDDSRYETLRYLPTWRDTYRTEGQVGPLGALTVNDGYEVLNPRPVPVDDPALFAAEELTRLLAERGVDVGSAGRATAPADATAIASVQSRPLRDVVASLLRSSDNLSAELLVREVGFHLGGAGTTSAGTQALLSTLADLGVATEGVTLVDGSGLDRGDRASCRALVAALDLGARAGLESVLDGLAVAGRSGTLRRSLVGTPLEGRLRAKTGSLQGVTALTGVVDLGRPLLFAFLANGDFSEGAGVSLRERVAAIIAAFPLAPPADVLVPGPAAA